MATKYDAAIAWLMVNFHPVTDTDEEVASDISARLERIGCDTDTINTGVDFALRLHAQGKAMYERLNRA